jgi:hypothetical protein
VRRDEIHGPSRLVHAHRRTHDSVEDIDISVDPALLDRYGLEIPVLLIDGRKAAKYRVSEQELTQMLDRRRG